MKTSFFNRTTMGVWMVAITQPTVRASLNSAGTSLTTTRCLTSPPRSSPPLPTFCFTPPCDGAVGPEEETLHLGDDAQTERLFHFTFNKISLRTEQAQLQGIWSCTCMQVHPGEVQRQPTSVVDSLLQQEVGLASAKTCILFVFLII